MSQAKVDQYTKEKAHRRETIAKEKRNRLITKVILGLEGIAFVAWVGVSTVDYIKANRPVETIYTDISAIDNYVNSLYEEETEATTQSTESTETEETENE